MVHGCIGCAAAPFVGCPLTAVVSFPAMPLPVIADVFRCAVTLTGSGLQSATNVFHISAPGATASDVADGINSAAGAGDPWAGVNAVMTDASITVTPLDGVSGSHIQGANLIVPGAGGQPLFEASMVAKFATGLAGREHRGRMFIGPLSEDQVNAGVVLDTLVAGTLDAITDWIADLNGQAIPKDLVVASYKLSTASSVTSVTVTQQQRTQRRRLRRVTGR